MAVSLSHDAIARAQRAADDILAAATDEEPRAFRLSLARIYRELLEADRALCFLPTPGLNPFASEDFSAEWLDDFAASSRVVDEGSRRARTFGLEVWTQSLLVRGETRAFRRSEQYRRWMAPNQLHDAAGVAIYGDRNPTQTDAFVASYRGRGGRPYGARAVALLSLVRPAFRAGVHLQHVLTERLSAALRLLDDLPHGVAVVDERGWSLHRTPKLIATLAADPRAALLEEAMRRAARSALAQRTRYGGPAATLHDAERLSAIVRTERSRYRVSASAVSPGVFHRTLTAVILVEALDPTPLSPLGLMDRFGLTPREAEVAALLERGLRNSEIARRLEVSTHTAERHTERVLAKLGVHSRAAVGARLRDV